MNISDQTRRCPSCHNELDEGYFSHGGDRGGKCMFCERVAKYGLSIKDVRQIDSIQRQQCAICKQKVALEIDHDHATSTPGNVVVRGLLCSSCNKRLGMFKDNPEFLRAAATYLETPLDQRIAEHRASIKRIFDEFDQYQQAHTYKVTEE